MKKMMWRLLFLCVGISLFSCGEPEDLLPPIPQDLVDYNVFTKGSYWTYQDSLTKEIDSVYVTDAVTDEHGYYRDSLIINKKKVSFYPYRDTYRKRIYYMFTTENEVHKNQKLEYKILDNDWVPNGEMLDKFTVQGVEYSNVCKQIHQEEGSGKNQYSYFVKGIGCIKKSYSRWVENEDGKTYTLRDEVWELVRYKISDEPIRVISKVKIKN